MSTFVSRFIAVSMLMLVASACAAERAYPLWNGSESVAKYAERVNLPPSKSLELGGGIIMELVLIPSGKYIMGTAEPEAVDEAVFRKKIVVGQVLLAVNAAALLVMLVVVIVQAIGEKRRPQLSLKFLLLVTVTAGGCVLSGLHWQQSSKGLEQAQVEFQVSKSRFELVSVDEKPAHPVMLTKPFYMGKFPVTQEQYQAVIGANPSTFKGKDNPVDTVSWDDAQVFCKKLTEQTKHAVRLPTEAEWEFACRAGTTTAYYSGDAESDLSRVAWYGANSKGITHPVGQKEPNAFGLCDMLGNMWQWCQDWSAGVDYYSKSPTEDPEGPVQGVGRLLRGGSIGMDYSRCRSARRVWYFPADPVGGFRVVVPASK